MEPFITRAAPLLLAEDLATTTTQTPRLTQPYQMTTMTSTPTPVNHSSPRSHQASKLPGSAPVGQFVSALR